MQRSQQTERCNANRFFSRNQWLPHIKEEVHYNTQHITSLDWETYPIFRFPDVPEVEVEIIDRVNKPPLGAGEAAQGPSTAAIINAIYNASGIRIRDLPVDSSLLK